MSINTLKTFALITIISIRQTRIQSMVFSGSIRKGHEFIASKREPALILSLICKFVKGVLTILLKDSCMILCEFRAEEAEKPKCL